MARETEQMKATKLQFARDMVGIAVDLVKNPVVAMIVGVCAVNAIHKAGGDNPLYSNSVRGLMQAAAIAFPTVQGIAGLSGAGSSVVSGAAGYVGGAAVGLTAAAAAKAAATLKATAGATAAGGGPTLLPLFMPKAVIEQIMGQRVIPGQLLDS